MLVMVVRFIIGTKGLSDERISSIKTSDYGITPYLSYYNTDKERVKFDGGCLKQDPGSYFHGGIVNVYIIYEVSKNINNSNYPTLENCLFGPVKINILVMELDLIDMEVFYILALIMIY